MLYKGKKKTRMFLFISLLLFILPTLGRYSFAAAEDGNGDVAQLIEQETGASGVHARKDETE